MAKMTQSQERTWAMVTHLSALAMFIIPLGNVIGPLIIWLMKKDESKYVDDQGKESLNFQISICIYGLFAAMLIVIFIGFLLLIGLGILMLVLVVVAAIRASEGERFRYPFTIRLIN